MTLLERDFLGEGWVGELTRDDSEAGFLWLLVVEDDDKDAVEGSCLIWVVGVGFVVDDDMAVDNDVVGTLVEFARLGDDEESSDSDSEETATFFPFRLLFSSKGLSPPSPPRLFLRAVGGNPGGVY